MSREITDLGNGMLYVVYTIDQYNREPLVYKMWMTKKHMEEQDEAFKKYDEELSKLEYRMLFGDNERKD